MSCISSHELDKLVTTGAEEVLCVARSRFDCLPTYFAHLSTDRTSGGRELFALFFSASQYRPDIRWKRTFWVGGVALRSTVRRMICATKSNISNDNK